MNRHLLILDFALSSLMRHKYQTLAAALAFTLVVFLWSSVLMLSQGLKDEAHAVLSSAPQLIVQRISGGRQITVPDEYADTIARIRGVSSVKPRFWGYYFDPPSGTNYTVVGADVFPRADLTLSEGRFFREDEQRKCVIGRGVAEARIAGPDDLIPMKLADGGIFAPRVVGVFTTASALLTNDLIVMPSHEVSRLFAIPAGHVTDLVVEVGNSRETDTIARKIQEALPDARPVARDQILATYDAVFDWRAGVSGLMVGLCTVCFLILAWDKATGLSLEQRRLIGVLKASGWQTREVLELKFWEGAAVSVVALLAGLALAWAHLLWFQGILFAGVMKGWSILMPSFAVQPRLDLFQLFLLLSLAVAPYIAATIIPSWKAAATDPMTAMSR